MEDSATGSATGAPAQSSTGPCLAVDNGRISTFANVQATTFNLINNGSGDEVGSRRLVSNAPNLLERNFVGRPEKSAMLAVQLHDNLQESRADSRIAVVQGIGGAGKTQLVLQYIKEFESDYQGVFWVSLVSTDAALRDVIEIYRLLGATEDFQSLNRLRLDQLMARIKGHIVESGRWLWVLDNADNVDDRQDSGHADMWAHIPESSNVQVIVTTRLQHVASFSNGKTINVDEMTEVQAQEVFWKGLPVGRAEASEENQKVASHLIAILGHHALAITMVSAAIGKSTRMLKDFSIFLQQFETSQRQVLDRFPDSLRSRYHESLLTSWMISFDAVQRRSQLAASLLQFLCFLDPDHPSLKMFEHAFEHGTDLNWTESLSNGLASRPTFGDIADAFDMLVSFSLLRCGEESSDYTMHKLIHACTLQYVLNKQSKDIAICATRFLCIAKASDNHISHCFQTAKSINGRTREELLEYCDVLEASAYMIEPLTVELAAGLIPNYLYDAYSQLYGEEHRRTMYMLLHLSAISLLVALLSGRPSSALVNILKVGLHFFAEETDLGRFRGVDSFMARMLVSYVLKRGDLEWMYATFHKAYLDHRGEDKCAVAFDRLKLLYSKAVSFIIQAVENVCQGEQHVPLHPYLLLSMWYTEELIEGDRWDEVLDEGVRCLGLPACRFQINDLNCSALLRVKVNLLIAQLKLSDTDEYEGKLAVFFRDLMTGQEASFITRLEAMYKPPTDRPQLGTQEEERPEPTLAVNSPQPRVTGRRKRKRRVGA